MIKTDRLIICVAPLGSFMGEDMNPNIPLQPGEIAEEVYRAWNEGASIVHIHARDKNGIATTAPEVFRDIGSKIRRKGCDIILQYSTSPGREPGSKVEDGLRSIEANPEMGSVDIGVHVSMRRGEEKLFLWTRSFVGKSLRLMLEREIKPELEVFGPGGIEEIKVHIEEGLLKKPYWISFIMDMHRTQQESVRYSPKNLMNYVEMLPGDSMFSTMGIAESEVQAAIQSILLGGHVRVGMEDNLLYRKGILAESNAQLVARVARIARELGGEPASPGETRDLLGIPRLRE